MICVECGSEMRKSTEPIKEIFRGEELTITSVEHYKCDHCGEIVLSADNGKIFDNKLVEQYAKVSGLSPSEIKSFRTQLGLKQTEFEKMLGVTSPSVSRWESGKVCQSKPVDLLMRAYMDAPYLAETRIAKCEIRAMIVPFPLKAIPEKTTNSFNLDYKEM